MRRFFLLYAFIFMSLFAFAQQAVEGEFPARSGDNSQHNSSKTMTVNKGSSPGVPDFKDVDAQLFANHIRLSWSIAGEDEGGHYQIERAANGDRFEPIGNMNSLGRSLYSYFDNRPLRGSNFYRIAYEAEDGKISYSETIDIVFTPAANQLKAFAGYNKIVVTLDLPEPSSYQLAVVNSYGQPVMRQELKYNGGRMNFDLPLASSLPPGIYSIIVRGDGQSLSCQILIK